jgi:transcriptional regulator with XRE-family HTH domain
MRYQFDREKLWALREQRQIRREDVARAVDRTYASIRNYEVGIYVPDANDLAALCTYFNVSPARFFTRVKEE